MLQLQVKKMTIYAGVQISILSYRHASYTYIITQFSPNRSYSNSKKAVNGFEVPLRIYPTVMVSFDVKINNFIIKPFGGIEILEINMQEFYFHIRTSPSFRVDIKGPEFENCYFLQAGLIIPILTMKNIN